MLVIFFVLKSIISHCYYNCSSLWLTFVSCIFYHSLAFNLSLSLYLKWLSWTQHMVQFCSVTQSCLILCNPNRLQHARLPCTSPTPRACSNSYSLSWWCHPTISTSVIPFSSCLQFFPTTGSILMSQLFISGGQSIGASSSASDLPMNVQDWFPLGLTGLITFQSKGLSRVFSNTTVQKHQFFGIQPSLWSNSHIHAWVLGKP